MKQIEYLTSMLYSQLGITQTIMDGTADDKTMLNYYSRTIEPMVAAVADEMKRKFLQKQQEHKDNPYVIIGIHLSLYQYLIWQKLQINLLEMKY